MSRSIVSPPREIPGQARKVLTVWALTASGSFTAEHEPLLAKISVTTADLGSEAVSCQASDKTGRSALRRIKWRNVVVAVCLWLAYTLCSAAYSIINPFFPQEVRQAIGRLYGPWLPQPL